MFCLSKQGFIFLIRRWQAMACMALLGMFLSACNGSEKIISPTVTFIPIHTAQGKALTTATPELTATKKPAKTITLTPIPDPTSSILVNPYPVQTLSEAALAQKMDILNEQSGCALPCWNNLTPGISSSSEVQGFFASLGIDLNRIYQQGSLVLESDYGVHLSHVGGFEISVFWKDQIVNKIAIYRQKHDEHYSVSRIASVLGTPDLIMIGGYGEDIPYTIVLLYTDRQVYIEIKGYGRYRQPPDQKIPFEACLSNQKDGFINFILFSENQTQDIINHLSEMDEWASDLGISTEELFEQMQTPNICIPFK